jgi:chaperonin GroEL (HSP60 family)
MMLSVSCETLSKTTALCTVEELPRLHALSPFPTLQIRQATPYVIRIAQYTNTLSFIQTPGIEQYAMRAFATALDNIPMALAENSGLSPIETLAAVKSRQVRENNSRLGVDCMGTGQNDMREAFVIDPLIGKRQQLLLATQLCRMVLKVNNVIISGSGEDEV